MSDDERERSRMSEGIDIIIDEAKTATKRAYKRSGAEDLGGSIKDTIRGALSPRDNVVMVRLNDESLAKLDELVEAGIVSSRSEAAAFLIGEGAAARAPAIRAHRREDRDDQEGQGRATQPRRRGDGGDAARSGRRQGRRLAGWRVRYSLPSFLLLSSLTRYELAPPPQPLLVPFNHRAQSLIFLYQTLLLTAEVARLMDDFVLQPHNSKGQILLLYLDKHSLTKLAT